MGLEENRTGSLEYFGDKGHICTRNRLLRPVILKICSGYYTCIQNMKLVITKFKSGGLQEKHVVATWNLGNRLSICLETQGNQEKPVSRWSVAGPYEY